MNNGYYRAVLINLLVNFATFGAALFIPNIAAKYGATGIQLSAIISFYNLAIFLTSWYFGRLADVRGKRVILMSGLFLSAITCFTHIFISSISTLFLIRILFGATIGIYTGALVAYAYESGKKLGIYAGFGAGGTAIGSLVVGMIGNYTWIFIVCSLFMVSAFAVALTLTFQNEKKHAVPLIPRHVLRNAVPAYLGVLIRHSGATAIWTIFPVFLAKIGCTPAEIGILYMLNTATQAITMFALDRYASTTLLPIGFGLSAVTFLTFTFASNFVHMVPTQVLLGISWATMYVGALKYINERNAEHATASGLLSSTTSLANIIGPVITGIVIGTAAVSETRIETFHIVMYLAALFALVSLIVYFAAQPRRTYNKVY
jgi:MFS family permease